MAIEQKIQGVDLERAAKRLQMLKYFRPEITAAVLDELEQMCPHRRALNWLIDEMVQRVGVWQGPTELRALLCSRFDPRDGVDAWSNELATRAEQDHYERHKQLTKAEGFIGESVPEFKRLLEGAAERKRLR
jgi:hypothetical protein